MNANINYVHVVDEDVPWLRAQVDLLNETIRQTLADGRPSSSHAVRTLTVLRDRYERIARRLEPVVTYTYWPPQAPDPNSAGGKP